MKAKSILIVEDDLFTSRLISSFFERKGFITYQAYDSGAAFMYAADKNLDVIILDVTLPTDSGVSIVQKLKSISPCPVIFYSSVTTEEMEIKALETGGDDFINKQRGLNVLYARIDRLLSKDAVENETTSSTVSINNILLDAELSQCDIGGKIIELQKKESKVLNFLMLHKNSLVNRDEISYVLNGYAYDGWSRSIDLIICRLRKKLKAA
ncbi:response regulator with CheY-like receiver domain and winged-helix DNA-binding domain [Shewanella psychrophila]|uniref:Response regulator with CheY-like receiver domain and winged-helix DNA-binding domain n=1 Tax=Shewanella psychrophila TaxID=225848 RepID=A0A1S6HU72_9GAMM|nr:response regulator transcription factor [Shewanella psychrophila]AQS39117.1 response regulator with CheY-like receiver domain and winged-helix DNA-binding domain [Shewanella psychrophila]